MQMTLTHWPRTAEDVLKRKQWAIDKAAWMTDRRFAIAPVQQQFPRIYGVTLELTVMEARSVREACTRSYPQPA